VSSLGRSNVGFMIARGLEFGRKLQLGLQTDSVISGKKIMCH